MKIAKRLVVPRYAFQFWKAVGQGAPPSVRTDDARLEFYHSLTQTDFLHYGYFPNPDIAPERLSVADIQEAQIQYGKLLARQIQDPTQPVLDAGCGMGGLIRLLRENGMSPVALTPNRSQIRYIQSRYPGVPALAMKFEDLPVEQYRQAFGTVLMSESLQYMNLARALQVTREILRPGGRWIVCDYFRKSQTSRRSGHRWAEFQSALAGDGWTVRHEQDITANVLPTLSYIHMWSQRAGLPLIRFLVSRLNRKRPALHFLLDEVIGDLRQFAEEQIRAIDPAVFAAEKQYMFLVMERA